MNWIEWSSSIVASCAWPVALIVIVVLLRSKIEGIIKGLRQVKYGKWEIKFSEELAELTTETNDLPEVVGAQQLRTHEDLDNVDKSVREVAIVSPVAAVSLAWSHLEKEILATAHRLGMQTLSRENISLHKAISTLVGSDKLSRDEMRLMRKMEKMRNMAVHQSSELSYLTSNDAETYWESIKQVAARLRTLTSA